MRWTGRKAPVAALVAFALVGLAQPAGADSRTSTSLAVAVQEQPGAPAGQGAGARTPFVEQQAEDARTNGTVLGPDWAYGTLAAEAVGRRAVELDKPGEYVEFKLKKAANAVNVRYSVPDSADGKGIDATLGTYVNGRFAEPLAVTSRYSWYYGQFPWTNNPADGGRRQLYDDARLMFDHTLPAGSTVRLQVGKNDKAPRYVIDTADFEYVGAPKSAPHRALSVTSFGADPSGKADSSTAFQRAIDAASGTGRTVWIPPGTFTVTRHLIVDHVTMRGSGPWYSVLHGAGVGVYGDYAPDASSDVHLADFAIFGEVTERDDSDQVNGIGGALAHSTVDNIWIQHTKVGAWLDGPFDDLRMSRLRILDVTADAVNFHDGITNSSVTDSYVRGTGDDGLAMWSDRHPNSGNAFARNTVKSPALANNIALYGGRDNKVTDNLVTDTLVQGGGIHVGNRFGAVPLAGTTTIARNTLQRTGTLDLFSHIGEGALWFWAADAPLTGRVDVEDNLIQNSAYEAVQFLGSSVEGVRFARNTIDRAGTFAFQLNAPGSASVRSLAAAHLGAGGRYDCDSGFTLTEGPGNRGWSTARCGYPSPGPLQVSSLDGALSFETDEVGKASDPQTVVVTNPGPRPVRIASVSITGVYALTDTCDGLLAPGASCTVDVRFIPTKGGDRNGSLTISDGTSAGRYQVHVTGRVVRSTVGNLAAGRPVVASGSHDGYPAANAVDSNSDTYWESSALTSPQSLTVDLGGPVTAARVSLKLSGGWGGRTQNVEVLASDDGETFTTVAAPADHAFDPTANNTVDITVPSAPYRYLRVQGTSNTGAPGLQLAEFEVYVD
ncbi:discoidin domain-containing protein [Streptomyces sp. NPDC102409]|uniref:discoidin domain-containing protein n=1 Tax=Streptomyces sp. NPDC102409 TaxID=3366172 RepID=UPI00382337C8